MRNTKSYKEDLFERLKSKEYAVYYLSAAFKDRDPKVFIIALEDVVEARGESLRQILSNNFLEDKSTDTLQPFRLHFNSGLT